MASEISVSLLSILDQLLPVLEEIEGTSQRFKESLAILQGIQSTQFVDDLARTRLNDESCAIVFHRLATCLDEARILKSDYLSEAFNILADASRKPEWRYDLGKRKSRSKHAGWPPNPKHESYGYSHEQWLDISDTLAIMHFVSYQTAVLTTVVLECGGLELLLRCANLKLWPDTVTTALWNICAESEPEAGAAAESANEDDSDMSTIACIQLSLRSIRECDDLNGMSLLAGEIEDGRRHASTIKDLLGLADAVTDGSWKEMVAELLEKATSGQYHIPPTGSVKNIIPRGTRLIKPDLRPQDFLSELLTGSGRRLAMSHPECNCDVTRAIAILLSQEEMQQELIREDLVSTFLEVPSWESTASEHNAAGHKVPRAMTMVRQSLFKTIYDVSALAEFAARYAKVSECPRLVSSCIDALGNVSNMRQTKVSVGVIPATSACVVLANLTKSTDFALFLVQHRKVHLAIGLILRQREDSTTVFPALALLDRLAIPPENKVAIVDGGIISELLRFVNDFDVQPMVQREAVSVMRKAIIGFPKHVSAIGVGIAANGGSRTNSQLLERNPEQSGLLAALNLFRRTGDGDIKTEVGRLVVEVCRTLRHSTRGQPALDEGAVRQALGSADDIASPISFLTIHGPSQQVRGEGWFGLAALSTWEYGRPFVVDCLADEAVQKGMEKALEGSERASCQNISLMLTELRLFPSHLVPKPTRLFLESAASSVGLPAMWPVMAPAA
ncbi:hypothetical protein EPUS_03208 [Endocarpon pusillum Z07020]|uniref:Uncharacterized protein n=1 Tax=Endocarpon pusillum (strain Z07020 / HMAS-L-300199) TaxID=1263415 RepID=U1HZ52_ENDPU|nr:uncharacterized protein EPUS_03208 [Endocarpon pusillum Z07020]ERF74824.1 hypothetical protein EPUS_03208 [Endocarpon pusillum Z07020]